MIRLILFRFWPAFLPLVIYLLWHRNAVRLAKKEGAQIPHFREGPIYWAVLASLVIAVFCFLVMAIGLTPQKGDYVPPVVKEGTMVPGHVAP
jgi:hypothetical protein